MKKILCIALCAALMASVLLVVPASAATNSNPFVVRPYQYTSVAPTSSGAEIVYRETFDSVSSPEEAGYFPGYLDYGEQPAYFIQACDLSLVSGHSGKGLLVSNRDTIYGKKSASGKTNQLDHTGGEFSFVMTNNYPTKGASTTSKYADKSGNFLTAYEEVANEGGGKDIGSIIAKYVSDVTDKQDVTFFFSMWVYTETAQTFLPKIQYMGSNELWIPADDYWEVPAKTWTQIGAIVQDGKTYYSALVGEGGSEAYGVYGAMASTTESKFCMATKSKDASGNVTFTNGDYIIDDITIWKVSDKSKIYDMQYTLSNKSTYTGLDGLVQITNKEDIVSKKVVNAFKSDENATTKKAAAKATTKKAAATKKATTATKVVNVTNAAGEVVGTKKIVITEAAATATGTETGTATGTEATGTATGTEATATATEAEAVTTATDASGEPIETETGSLLWLWILIGVVVVGGGAAAGIVLSKKKGAAPAAEAEAPAEDAPAEETPSDNAE